MRAKAGLPQLYDVDDLPDHAYDPNYVHVLTEAEELDLHSRMYNAVSSQQRLIYFHPEQEKFQRSQTWYRAHGTETHRVNYLPNVFI